MAREIITIPQKYQDFVKAFYKTSDKPGAHSEYADWFTRDATCNFSGESHTGRDDILKMREGMWEQIVKRDHHPDRIFIGEGGKEAVIWGSADFTKKSGELFQTTYFARMTFEDPDADKLLMTSYEVCKRQGYNS